MAASEKPQFKLVCFIRVESPITDHELLPEGTEIAGVIYQPNPQRVHHLSHQNAIDQKLQCPWSLKRIVE